MSTFAKPTQKTVEPTDDQLVIIDTDAKPIFNVVNQAYDDEKEHTYTVIADGNGVATSCTCPHYRYRCADTPGSKCKHQEAVEESRTNFGNDSDFCTDKERVTGPYTGFDCYGTVDHTYWRCEACGAECTDKRALGGVLGDCC